MKNWMAVKRTNEVPEDMQEDLNRMPSVFQWTESNPTLTSQQLGFLKSLALYSFEPPRDLEG